MTQENQKTNAETADKKSSTHQIFTFEWENVFRIIGSITGIAGIAAALLYVFGFARIVGKLESLGIRDDYYSVSIPHERYLLNGFIPFFSFIASIVGLLISYYIARALVQTIGQDILKRISRPFISLIAGVALGIFFLYVGISNLSDLYYGSSYAFFFIFIGIDILMITFETVFIKDDNKHPRSKYYGLINSTITIIKTTALVFVIFFMLSNKTSSILTAGNSVGCNYLTDNPISATIYSEHSIGLDGETNNTDSYIYNGYFLLYTDNNYYYLFRELDPENLKPKSVILVKRDAIEAVQLESTSSSPNWNLTKTCSELYGN